MFSPSLQDSATFAGSGSSDDSSDEKMMIQLAGDDGDSN